MSRKKDEAWMIISIGSFVVMSISFLLMPINMTVKRYGIIEYVPGLVFWVGLVTGIIGQIVLIVRCRKRIMRHKAKENRGHIRRIGLFYFFQNVPAIIVDLSLVISLTGVIISTNVTQGMSYICYIFLSVCTLAFCLHCIFNGNT